MLLCGCVGGGSSQTPPSSAIDIKTEQLYSELATAPNQLYADFAIDTDSPVISSFAAETTGLFFGFRDDDTRVTGIATGQHPWASRHSPIAKAGMCFARQPLSDRCGGAARYNFRGVYQFFTRINEYPGF